MTDYAWGVLGFIAAALTFAGVGFYLVLQTLPPKR
jgi:hypothetical protein